MDHLNLFFKKLVLIATLLACPTLSWAVNLHAIYTASCQREVGVILGVSPRQISLLNLKGQIVNVERFEAIYYVNYPLDAVPISAVINPEKVPLTVVKTFQGGHLVPLVSGWPVDFSQDKVSFLSLRGSELVIDRTSIWDIQFTVKTEPVHFSNATKNNFEFVPPYAFANCAPENKSGSKNIIKVYPQDVLSDPVKIKREFDRLQDGQHVLRKYESAEQFYPVPEVYSNLTTLGLWLTFGSRYGASDNRNNNFTPLLTNEFSSGPFGFQSEFKSGSGFLTQSIHEETQTQIYYRMKADYFHLSLMVDPSLVLVGEKYKWSRDDLTINDLRAVESAFVELGFDFGPLAIELYPGTSVNIGARFQDLVTVDTMSLPRVGLRYQGYRFLATAQGGSGSNNGFSASFFRANFEYRVLKNWRWSASAIIRNLKFKGVDDVSKTTAFVSESTSQTLAGNLEFRFHTRYRAGAFVAVESVNQSGGLNSSTTTSDNHLFPKFGTMVSLSF